MSELGFQIALTAFLSLIVSSIDLFRDYKEETLNKAWIWVLFYLALNIGASVFVFVVSLNADVTISMSKNRISLSEINEWVKSVFCGMFLLVILKSRLFMIKIGKSNDVINPEYRFQQIVNIIKLKIAERGLSGNLEKMQRLLVSLSVDELINGANLIIRVDELWQYSDKKKQSAIENLNKINKIKDERKKKESLCKFIFDFGGEIAPEELFVERMLSYKKWRDLIVFLEQRSDSFSHEDISYINKLREDHMKVETLELKNDNKDEIIELIFKHYTHSEIFEFLNK